MALKFKAVIATIAAAALATSGTFAFHQMATAANEFIGKKDGVTLHDDFDPGIGKKDVFVENQGEEAMFVRVKLEEAMSLEDHKWRPSASDWKTHVYGLAATDCGKGNGAGELFHNYFSWKMGGSKWYMPTDGSKQLVHDLGEYDQNTEGAKQTPYAEIISATSYLAMTSQEQKAFIGWIYTDDGYAYWSRPLLSGEATGLLLSGVATSEKLKHSEYYYVINVGLEVVDFADLPMWTDGSPSVDGSGATHDEASKEGKEVIDIIAGLTDLGKSSSLFVREGPFAPIYDGDPGAGDTYYYKFDYVKGPILEPDNCAIYHFGAVHLEDIIKDGGESGVTVKALNAKYSPFISIGACERHGNKPAVIFSYMPSNREWYDHVMGGGNDEMDIPVKLDLARGGESAEITIIMSYRQCLLNLNMQDIDIEWQ